MNAVLALITAASLIACVVLATRCRSARAVDATVAGSEPAAPDREAQDNQSRLEAAVDELSVGVTVSTADGEQLFANRVASDIAAAHDRRSLVADTMVDVTRAAQEGRRDRREIEVFGPPAEHYAVSAVPLTGRAEGEVVAFVENVSERHRLDQVRRDFVANISHELKTPVGAVALLADTLQDETDLEVVSRLSGRLAQEVARLSATIDDLLELSSIEFEEQTDLEDLAPESIVAEAVARLRAAAEARDVLLAVEVDATRPVYGDRRQLVSAVFNLLDNAVKYSPEGERVTVRAFGVEDAEVCIEVEDRGIGIPARDLDRVFERFYRVDRARARGTGGTGLGLAIVRHVAQNHGGVASVSSREGTGSTFRLLLPAVSP